MTSEARFFVNVVVLGLGEILFVVSCLFAWIKGGAGERIGASVFCAAVLGTLAEEMITHQATPVLGELLLDTVAATAFLALAIRYNNLWLGTAMIVKGLQLALHATHLTDGDDPYLAGFNLYAASLNFLSDLTCLSLIAATLSAIKERRRRRARASQAASPAAATTRSDGGRAGSSGSAWRWSPRASRPG